MVYHGVILVDVMFRLRFKPLGAYRIANVLREAGYNILVIDMYSTLSLDELKSILDKTITKETLFLGYSSTMFGAVKEFSFNMMGIEHPNEPGIPTSREYFIETNEHVKKINPNLKIIYGGACTVQMKGILASEDRELHIDYMVEGYSEGVILDIVNNIKERKPQQHSSSIRNVQLINYDTEAKLYDFRNHTQCWDSSDLVLPGEVLPLEVARGCIFKCRFCTYPLLGKKKNDLSYLRTEECLAHDLISNYENSKTLHYVIVDDTFNERTDKLEILLRARDKAKLDLHFSAYIRLDLVAAWPEQLQLLKDLNVSVQYYGIETLTERSAKAIGKGGNSDKLIETIYKMHDIFNGNVNLQSGHIIGLPYETRDSVEESINRMLSTPLDSVLFLPLWLGNSAYGESEFLKNPQKYGYEHLGDGLWKNEHWDAIECINLAFEYEKKYLESGRTGLGLTEVSGMLNLGYDYQDILKMKSKDFLAPDMIKETMMRHHDHRKRYFTALREYLNL